MRNIILRNITNIADLEMIKNKPANKIDAINRRSILLSLYFLEKPKVNTIGSVKIKYVDALSGLPIILVILCLTPKAISTKLNPPVTNSYIELNAIIMLTTINEIIIVLTYLISFMNEKNI